MPIYDFHCENCGAKLNDHLVKADEEVLCKECGTPMTKCLGTFSFKFTPSSISKFKKKVGNTLPPEYKTSGGANIYGIPRKN